MTREDLIDMLLFLGFEDYRNREKFKIIIKEQEEEFKFWVGIQKNNEVSMTRSMEKKDPSGFGICGISGQSGTTNLSNLNEEFIIKEINHKLIGQRYRSYKRDRKIKEIFKRNI